MSKTSRKTPRTKLWTSPSTAAQEIFTDLTANRVTPSAARRLSDALTHEVFPSMEPSDILDVAARLAQLHASTEVAAAMTLLLRVGDPKELCRVWRDAIQHGIPETATVRRPQVIDVDTAEYLQAQADDAPASAEEARIALLETDPRAWSEETSRAIYEADIDRTAEAQQALAEASAQDEASA